MSVDIFEDGEQKHEKLLAIFDTLPTMTLYGVVGANYPTSARSPPDTRWSLSIQLVAWRVPGEPVQRAKLLVTKEVSNDELHALCSAIYPESIIAFTGKICEISPFGDTRAQLVGLHGRPKDEELELVLSEAREPVEIFDPVIGKLVLNKSIDWFEGSISWLGRQIGISISVDESGAPGESIRTAKALLEAMELWANRVNSYAVTELLDLKNDNWLSDDECPISREEFVERMQLNSITTYPDGAFEFWHEDGDLFWGHSIQVCGSLSAGLTGADIPG